MSDKFQDIYRIPTTRARWWNYSHKGLYFVTICTYGMECCLGQIENSEIYLSPIGKIAEASWKEIPIHMPFVKLHAMVVMPNHVHGIIEILPVVLGSFDQTETEHAPSVLEPPASFVQNLANAPVQTLHATSLAISNIKNNKMAAISPKKGSLASIIRSYKSAVSYQVHRIHPKFSLKERYYDNIIKGTPAYQRIEAYIENNVSSWNKDKFFKE